MLEFTVNNPQYTARFVACRMAMITGLEGPLAWDEPTNTSGSMPSRNGNIWDLGNCFRLEDLGGELDQKKYKLIHPELDRELEGLKPFVEWLFR